MAYRVDKEKCFHTYFANEPKLRIHYFIINSFYENHDRLLDCDEVMIRFKVLLTEIYCVVNEINYCKPQAVAIDDNPNNCKFIITERGRSGLEHDISKLVPPIKGIKSDELKAPCPGFILKLCLRNNWLCMTASGQFDIWYVRGTNYFDFHPCSSSMNLIS